MFENHRKSRIQHCERSELRLQMSGQKLIKNAKKIVKNGKIEIFKCDILSNFQTPCTLLSLHLSVMGYREYIIQLDGGIERKDT